MEEAAPGSAAWRLFPLRRLAADGRGARTATAIRAVTHEFLYALSGIDFAGIDIALAVEADLVQPVKITGHPSAMSEPAELLQFFPAHDVDCLVGFIADVETALWLVRCEVHRYGSAGHHR